MQKASLSRKHPRTHTHARTHCTLYPTYFATQVLFEVCTRKLCCVCVCVFVMRGVLVRVCVGESYFVNNK